MLLFPCLYQTSFVIDLQGMHFNSAVRGDSGKSPLAHSKVNERIVKVRKASPRGIEICVHSLA